MRTTRNRTAYAAAFLLAVVFVTTAARGQKFSVLYDFGQNPNDPINPSYSGILAQGRDGNLYGTVAFGGAFQGGAMIKVTPRGKLTVVYSFDGSVGFAPFGGLTLATDGNFYGTNGGGGKAFLGTIFKITPDGRPTLLYEFTGQDDGAVPYAPPIQGADGNLYGTTEIGGTSHAGTVYKITPAGVLTTLHSFDNANGAQPIGPLLQASDGNFYGTTVTGGGPANAGTVFKITPAGKLTVIHRFDGSDGFDPSSLLIQGSDSSLYGTAYSGGTQNTGTIFKITPQGKFSVLHNFNGSTDGGNPYAGLVQGSDGNFYGVNSFNGNAANQGTIFRISPGGKFKVLYTFDGKTGATPQVTLLQHTNGSFFGDATFGGAFNNGTFYGGTAGLKPFVSLVNPFGKVGKNVEILGQGFAGATSVTFNGTTATYRVVSDTYLTATVPAGASSGLVVVTTPQSVLTSSRPFQVIP
jgi:uncharacterized repeat protein (TIGR03803 family)